MTSSSVPLKTVILFTTQQNETYLPE